MLAPAEAARIGQPGLEATMELAAVYPSYELGSDPSVLRDFAQAAEGAGYTRLVLAEHVLGAHPDRLRDHSAPYTYEHEWPEPIATLGFLAAVTQRIELMTGILILPQRQTVLVAKQAAQLDVLSGGRLILGVGTGWNPVEYEALGQDFHTRGSRIAEQIELLRLLWAEPLVTFHGRWHHVERAGLNPLPPRRSIPVWMGGSDPRAVARAGRLGDGWYPLRLDQDVLEARVRTFREAAVEAGRDPQALGLQGSITGLADLDAQLAAARGFEALGATHVALFTTNVGFRGAAQHLGAMTGFARAMA
jgi:probable F420-dependent oxidoreductase